MPGPVSVTSESSTDTNPSKPVNHPGSNPTAVPSISNLISSDGSSVMTGASPKVEAISDSVNSPDINLGEIQTGSAMNEDEQACFAAVFCFIWHNKWSALGFTLSSILLAVSCLGLFLHWNVIWLYALGTILMLIVVLVVFGINLICPNYKFTLMSQILGCQDLEPGVDQCPTCVCFPRHRYRVSPQISRDSQSPQISSGS